MASGIGVFAEDDHAGHDHAAHAGDHSAEEASRVPVTREQVERFGIKIAVAEEGTVANVIRAPGEIAFNEDRVVHMVPRVAGIARKVLKRLGDHVEKGESLAVIDSRELADAKSEYLAAKARGALAEKVFAREKALHEKRVSPEEDYIEAEVALAEARIALRSARQKLLALGLPPNRIEALDSEDDAALTEFELLAPITGVVTEKHISQGESLQADAEIFTVADLSTVWVNLAISQEAIGSVRKDQSVTVRLPDGSTTTAKIEFVSPTVDAETRTALARVTLDNGTGAFRPGTFVGATIQVPSEKDAIVVPKASIQLVHDHPSVFVWKTGAFELREVETGSADGTRVEVVRGLAAGEKVAAVNAFHLKAEYIKSAAGDVGGCQGHSH
jgi:cobalt-zinc-cadmium efflux system membrane fusion protein